MAYQEITPSEFLVDYIESYWFFHNTQDSAQRMPIIPDCCMDIIFDLSSKRVLICGVMTTAQTVTIQPNQKLYGIRFQPGILPVILGIYADSLQDTIVALKDVNGELYKKVQLILALSSPEEISEACNGIFEQEFKETKINDFSTLFKEKDVVDFSVKNFAYRVGMSVRHLERLFVEYVGVTPKRFLKIRRLQSLKKSLQDGKQALVSLSLQHGYVDQSHMNKEYKQLTGKSIMR
ncbi:MAG: helix-turn-helix transcriptional regulator [Candidatus Moraniibacteriota bacterium]